MRVTTALLLSLLPTALSLVPPLRRRSTNSTSKIEIGPDDPTDPETTGYFINYLSLNTNNLTRSMDFYTTVFGMRFMFTYHITEYISITYMGYSQGGRNGSAYQTTREMIRNKQNAAGMIELVYFNRTNIGGEPILGGDKMTSTFNHIGMIVPDPSATQARLEKFGVTIYKKLGARMPKDGPMGSPSILGDASNLSPEAFEEIQEEFTKLNALNIFAADPDGNLLEILPLNEPPMFG